MRQSRFVESPAFSWRTTGKRRRTRATARPDHALGSAAVSLFLGAGLAFPGLADPPPARVVSMNLCTDQLAMLLAAPGQLISVSNIAAEVIAGFHRDLAALTGPDDGPRAAFYYPNGYAPSRKRAP